MKKSRTEVRWTSVLKENQSHRVKYSSTKPQNTKSNRKGSISSMQDLNLIAISQDLNNWLYRSSYHLTPASNRCLVYATLVRTSFGINFRPFLNML
ncbi:hypothetical protein, partial [Aeromonas caviae]|uniref:hypothetical protein n=1 Tax=Aeromonas caviae TaxID=648 RepID=UPI001FC8A54E